jgi:hypothetical protein
MTKPFQIAVFGKPDCEKCGLLNRRLDDLLARDEWADFDKIVHDVTTVNGLVAFAQTECLNPSRIPGFLVSRWDAGSQTYRPLSQTLTPATARCSCASLLTLHLGLQTDYGPGGKGLLSPTSIRAVLSAARNHDDGKGNRAS